MNIKRYFFLVLLLTASCLLSSCCRNGDVWENTKSAGRYMKKGMKALTGTHTDSRQIQCRDEFECIEDDLCYAQDDFQDYSYADEAYGEPSAATTFVPLSDPENELGRVNGMAPSNETPGEPGSPLPGIQYFRDPNGIPQMAGIFQPIHFPYDSSLIKGTENLHILHAVSEFLRNHPSIYVFIEGHTDERGPQAYNLALGSRRANAVRNLLISEGVHPDHLFTISYGKERPIALGHDEEAWSQNRRAEFKIYER